MLSPVPVTSVPPGPYKELRPVPAPSLPTGAMQVGPPWVWVPVAGAVGQVVAKAWAANMALIASPTSPIDLMVFIAAPVECGLRWSGGYTKQYLCHSRNTLIFMYISLKEIAKKSKNVKIADTLNPPASDSRGPRSPPPPSITGTSFSPRGRAAKKNPLPGVVHPPDWMHGFSRSGGATPQTDRA